MPSKFPPGKTPTISYDKRTVWTQRVFFQNPYVVSTLEKEAQSTVFGRDIFYSLRLLHPKSVFCWILGEDQWEKLNFWKSVDEYAKDLMWLVLRRSKDAPQKTDLRSRRLNSSTCAYQWVDAADYSGISSSTIREWIQKNEKELGTLEAIPEIIRKDVIETYKKEVKR